MSNRTQAQRDETEQEAVSTAQAAVARQDAFDAAVRTYARAIDMSYGRGHTSPYDRMLEANRRRDAGMVEQAGAEALAWLRENA